MSPREWVNPANLAVTLDAILVFFWILTLVGFNALRWLLAISGVLLLGTLALLPSVRLAVIHRTVVAGLFAPASRLHARSGILTNQLIALKRRTPTVFLPRLKVLPLRLIALV